jgi:hypothetical protein
MKIMSINIFVLSLCLIFSNALCAQIVNSEPNKIEAREHLSRLKKGVLIVQIATQEKKIEHLKKMLKGSPGNEKIQERIEEARKESDDLLKETIESYSQHYTFSKMLFMPDTMVKRLYAGQTSGIFLDSLGHIDHNIRLETADFYISYAGYPPSSNTGKKSLVIVDGKGQLPRAPFPYAVPFYSFMGILLGNSDAESVEQAVIRQNKKLSKSLY